MEIKKIAILVVVFGVSIFLGSRSVDAAAICTSYNENICSFTGDSCALYFGEDYSSGYVAGDRAGCTGGVGGTSGEYLVCFYENGSVASPTVNGDFHNLKNSNNGCSSTGRSANGLSGGETIDCLLLDDDSGSLTESDCPASPNCGSAAYNCHKLPTATVGAAVGCTDGDCSGTNICVGGAWVSHCTNGVIDCGETDTDCGGGGCPACAASPSCPGSLSCTATIAASDVGCSCGTAIATAANVGDHCCSMNNTFYGTLAACNTSPCAGASGGENCSNGIDDDGDGDVDCDDSDCAADPACTGLPPDPDDDPISGIIPCGRATDNDDTTGWDESKPCTLCHIPLVGQLVIEFLVKMAAVFAVLSLIGGGLVYIVAAGSTSTMEKAKTIIRYALFGFLVVFIAWAIVNSILATMGYTDPIGGEWYMMDC